MCVNTGSHLWNICFSVQKTCYAPCYRELNLKYGQMCCVVSTELCTAGRTHSRKELQNFTSLSALRVNFLSDTTVEHRHHFIEQLRPAFQKFERLVSLELSATKVAVHLKRSAFVGPLLPLSLLFVCSLAIGDVLRIGKHLGVVFVQLNNQKQCWVSSDHDQYQDLGKLMYFI